MDTKELIKRITDTVSEYIAEEEAYSDDAQLQINTLTREMEIADPDSDLLDCDYWPIMDLVRMSPTQPGKWEPDPEAIAEVANDY